MSLQLIIFVKVDVEQSVGRVPDYRPGIRTCQFLSLPPPSKTAVPLQRPHSPVEPVLGNIPDMTFRIYAPRSDGDKGHNLPADMDKLGAGTSHECRVILREEGVNPCAMEMDKVDKMVVLRIFHAVI